MRDLVAEVVSEGVEATVPATVRETVRAVANATEPEGISRRKLAELLNLDNSAATRRWQRARNLGYLRNLEERRGKPARIVAGEPLPEDVEILPTLERLAERCRALDANYSRASTLDEALQDDAFVQALVGDGILVGPSTRPTDEPSCAELQRTVATECAEARERRES